MKKIRVERNLQPNPIDFGIRKILKKRRRNGKIEYKVRWNDGVTWEEKDTILFAPEKILEYERWLRKKNRLKYRLMKKKPPVDPEKIKWDVLAIRFVGENKFVDITNLNYRKRMVLVKTYAYETLEKMNPAIIFDYELDKAIAKMINRPMFK